jgi:hypothetical protein
MIILSSCSPKLLLNDCSHTRLGETWNVTVTQVGLFLFFFFFFFVLRFLFIGLVLIRSGVGHFMVTLDFPASPVMARDLKLSTCWWNPAGPQLEVRDDRNTGNECVRDYPSAHWIRLGFCPDWLPPAFSRNFPKIRPDWQQRFRFSWYLGIKTVDSYFLSLSGWYSLPTTQ